MKKIDEITNHLQNKMQAEHSVEQYTNYFKVSSSNYLKTAKYLKAQGFDRLLTVSSVDWIEEGNFEVYFILHSLSENIYVKVTTEIPRDNPIIPSLDKIWVNAGLHEQEMWEIFGITFEGNPNLKPLFLEKEPEIPPFRKDFNWREIAEH
ncbi:NADH-quinone oxidoreductase subunit C [Candidatus Heimdallarchaeota archaeon]|nr:MAG: NADH-quinone oxidoreductase subunit C [Candidatus Heimdallarchaeota archaeon]